MSLLSPLKSLARTCCSSLTPRHYPTTTSSSSCHSRILPAAPLVRLGQIWTRGFASKKHRNLLKHAKGYRGRSKNCFTVAIRRVEKAWQYAYISRKLKKRDWRKLWIQRIQAGCRQYSWRYSEFIPALTRSNINLNRKVLANMAANEPFAFKSVLDVVEHETGMQKRRNIAE